MIINEKMSSDRRRAVVHRPMGLTICLSIMLVLFYGSPVRGDNTTSTRRVKYVLPTISMRMLILEDDTNKSNFKLEITQLMKSHLETIFKSAFPTSGILNIDNYEEVEMEPVLEKRFQNERDSTGKYPVSVVRANFYNNRVRFIIRPDDILDTESEAHMEAISNLARSQLKDLVLTALTGEEYKLLIQGIKSNDVLKIIQTDGLSIVVDGRLVDGTGGWVMAGQEESSSGLSTFHLAAAIVFGSLGTILLFTTGGVAYYYLNSRRNNLTPEGKGVVGGLPGLQGDDASSGWLDEWTKSITSIPIRPVGADQKRGVAGARSTPARPARQARINNFLGRIPENEDDDENYGDGKEGPIDVDEIDDQHQLGENQFNDVDLAGPEDYEPRVVKSSMLYL